MKVIAPKVLLFLCFLFSHHLNADFLDSISWKKAAPALATAAVVTGVGYYFYGFIAQYLGKHIVKYGSTIGGFVSSVACTGFVVTALTGKNVFDKKSTIPVSGRIGSGIGGLALLFLSWRYWKSCRPGIEFYHVGLLPPIASIACMAVAGVTAFKPWHGTSEERDKPVFHHASIAVALVVGAVTAGIVSWKYYWRPTLYGA